MGCTLPQSYIIILLIDLLFFFSQKEVTIAVLVGQIRIHLVVDHMLNFWLMFGFFACKFADCLKPTSSNNCCRVLPKHKTEWPEWESNQVREIMIAVNKTLKPFDHAAEKSWSVYRLRRRSILSSLEFAGSKLYYYTRIVNGSTNTGSNPFYIKNPDRRRPKPFILHFYFNCMWAITPTHFLDQLSFRAWFWLQISFQVWAHRRSQEGAQGARPPIEMPPMIKMW